VGTVTSFGAALTVNPAPVSPTITTQPASQTVTAGQTATFPVVAAGDSTAELQWRKNNVEHRRSTFEQLHHAGNRKFQDSGSTFSVVVTNTVGTVTSSAAALTVNPAPVSPTIPRSRKSDGDCRTDGDVHGWWQQGQHR